MYPSQGRSRRQRAADPGDSSWADGARDDGYTHSNRYSQPSGSYDTSPSPHTEYEPRRRPQSSHDRSDAWRRGDEGRGTGDTYSMLSTTPDFHHEGRDDRQDLRPRDSGWPVKDPTSGRPRVESLDNGSKEEPFQESSSWAPPRNDGRSSDVGWTPESSRRAQRGERNNRYRPDDRRGDGRDRDTRKQNGRDDWRTRDDGWGSRVRSDENSNASSKNQSTVAERVEQASEDRWEPASSWQQNHRGGQSNQRNQYSYNNKSNNKGGKGHKKHNHNNKQRRDWRADDGHLNNWTRREPNSSNKNSRVVGKRQQQHSPSPARGRSRSPAESFHSRRSSRERSPSLDPPKRRRLRERSPSGRSRSPLPKSREKHTRPQQSWSRSPSISSRSLRSPDSRGWGRSRRHSVSSATSTSRSRSPSQSPRQRSRTVHRLPVSTSVKDIPFSLNRSPNKRGNRQHHKGNKNRAPADVPMRGRHLTSDFSPPPSGDHGYFEDMPPPASTRPLTGSRRSPSPAPQSSKISTTDHPYKSSSRTSRNAGFRPIGQPSSAVKKFFPDEEEQDDESPAMHGASSSTHAHSDLAAEERSDAPSFVTNGKHPAQHSGHSRLREPQSSPLESRGNGVPMSISESSTFHETSVHEVSMESLPSAVPPSGAQFGETEPITPTTRAPSPDRDPRGELYTIVSQVGEGTFGKVYKARNAMNGLCVALKRIRMEAERDGFPVTAMREIKLLQSLRHDNVVRLYEMMVSNGSVYMVFEYMDHDLTGILSQTQFSFTDAHLKSFCHQMLAGLAYLHHKGVIHRDIKGSNILINNRGELKLADFGLARFYQKRRRSDYTNRVITLWYRPPELLFGTTVYGPEVDMWSAGCIMLELFTKRPVFQGNDEIHQLDVIYKVLGTPTVERWPDMANLPWYELVRPKEAIPNYFRGAFQRWLSPAGLDLAERLLAYDPAQRVTALQALEAPYFHEEAPPAAAPTGLSTLEGEWHELETKRERAKKRKRPEGASQ